MHVITTYFIYLCIIWHLLISFYYIIVVQEVHCYLLYLAQRYCNIYHICNLSSIFVDILLSKKCKFVALFQCVFCCLDLRIVSKNCMRLFFKIRSNFLIKFCVLLQFHLVIVHRICFGKWWISVCFGCVLRVWQKQSFCNKS